jgi:hypothetical protein
MGSLRFGKCPRHGWVSFYAPLYTACPYCGERFLEEVPPSAFMVDPYIRRIMTNSLGFMETKFDNVFQSDVKDVVCFAVSAQNSYFPLSGEKCINVTYDSKYVKGNSLELLADVLQHRRFLWLGPLASPSMQANLEEAASKVVGDLERKGLNPNELVLSFTSGGEGFYSIASSFTFRRMGYIIFPEATLEVPIGGVPDLIAAKLGNVQKTLVEKGVIYGGAFLAEFELFNLFAGSSEVAFSSFGEEAIVVEVESAKLNAGAGRAQLREKYLPYGYFNAGYLACPERCEDVEGETGTITWDEKGREIVYNATIDYGKRERVNETLDFAKRLVLYTYLKNLPVRCLMETFGQASLAKIVDQIIKCT